MFPVENGSVGENWGFGEGSQQSVDHLVLEDNKGVETHEDVGGGVVTGKSGKKTD